MKRLNKILATTISISMALLSGCAADGDTTSIPGSDADDGIRIWAPETEEQDTTALPPSEQWQAPHYERIQLCNEQLQLRVIEAHGSVARVESALWVALECHADANDDVIDQIAPYAADLVRSRWERYRVTGEMLCEEVVSARGTLEGVPDEARCAFAGETTLSNLIDAYGALPKQLTLDMPTKADEACGDQYQNSLDEYSAWTDAATDLVSCEAKVVDTNILNQANDTLVMLGDVCNELAGDGSLERITNCRDSAALAVARLVEEEH